MEYGVLEIILSLFKSLVINVKLFGLVDGLRIPILFSFRCKVIVNKGEIILPKTVSFGVVKVGLNHGHFGIGNKDRSFFRVSDGGVIEFKGKANFAVGSVINVIGGKVSIGNHFSTNDRFTLSCGSMITIEDNVMVGWNCTCIDGDGHSIFDCNNNVVNPMKPIVIGMNSWIASDVKLMKGSQIPAYTVVAMGSIVTKKFYEVGTILAGSPARIVKRNVRWLDERTR